MHTPLVGLAGGSGCFSHRYEQPGAFFPHAGVKQARALPLPGLLLTLGVGLFRHEPPGSVSPVKTASLFLFMVPVCQVKLN